MKIRIISCICMNVVVGMDGMGKRDFLFYLAFGFQLGGSR
jgi:hypothetical protein